jgi:hypothetical protein
MYFSNIFFVFLGYLLIKYNVIYEYVNMVAKMVPSQTILRAASVLSDWLLKW